MSASVCLDYKCFLNFTHIYIFFACLRNKHIGETSRLSSNVAGVLKKAPGAEESQRRGRAHVSVCLVTQRPHASSKAVVTGSSVTRTCIRKKQFVCEAKQTKLQIPLN